MTRIGLRLGTLALADCGMVRSGFRWIVPDGHLCRPGEAIAFCNIGLRATRPDVRIPAAFDNERHDFQVVVAPRVGGRLRHAPYASRGGFLDLLHHFAWDETFELGWIEPVGASEETGADPGLLRLLMLAGRRTTELAEVRSGILTGWHDRSRAWWGEGSGPTGTLLASATCEQHGVLRGPAFAFLELFAEVSGPAQVAILQDVPLVPCARVLLEQMTRTPEQRAAIAEDVARGLGGPAPTAADWLFVGALMNALNRSDLVDGSPIIRRDGFHRAPPAAALLLSLNSEAQDVGRHRRLDYTVSFHNFRLAQAGPGVAHWLRTAFERVRRGVDDIRRDYVELLDHLRATTGARLLVLNANSSPAHEQIHSYAGFAEPMSATLGSVRAKELNLMLHDLARDHALDIIDADALTARLGQRDHMPDGTHFSGRLQAELRNEVLETLRRREVAGFGSR